VPHGTVFPCSRGSASLRLAAIRQTKASLSGRIPPLSTADISDQVRTPFSLKTREPVRRKIGRRVAPFALRLQQPANRHQVGAPLSFRYDLLTIGDRFAQDASVSALLRLTRRETLDRILVPGCYLGGEDVQFWLRRGARVVEGIDVYSLEKVWAHAMPILQKQYGAVVRFQQAPIESLPFADGLFELVASSAVLEHVQNLEAMIDETARVLKPGGWAWHSFGPLYYTYGADHCIAAYGPAHGYDHVLLPDDEYRHLIEDQAFFDLDPDPNRSFWARRNQFSFAEPYEYLAAFHVRFDVKHVVVIVSSEALKYREQYPDRWEEMRASGIAEESLLVKGFNVILRKKGNGSAQA
jgi:SAM-dependent methyltransferase